MWWKWCVWSKQAGRVRCPGINTFQPLCVPSETNSSTISRIVDCCIRGSAMVWLYGACPVPTRPFILPNTIHIQQHSEQRWRTTNEMKPYKCTHEPWKNGRNRYGIFGDQDILQNSQLSLTFLVANAEWATSMRFETAHYYFWHGVHVNVNDDFELYTWFPRFPSVVSSKKKTKQKKSWAITPNDCQDWLDVSDWS